MYKKIIIILSLLMLININFAEETPTPIVTFDEEDSANSEETPTPIVTFEKNVTDEKTPTPIVTFEDTQIENNSNDNTQIEKTSNVEEENIIIDSEKLTNKNIYIGIAILVILAIGSYFIFLKK